MREVTASHRANLLIMLIVVILRDSAHRWRCVGTLTSPHGKWVYVDRILLDG